MTHKVHNTEYQSVSDFYCGRSVLITGATGFLGKAYVEKLAYECRQIDKIYILIRNKKKLDLAQIIKNYLDQPFFARIKRERPEAITKIVPVIGDITSSNLGLSAEDQRTLIEKVSIVIHSAASIKFNQILKDALNINVEGTRNVLNLSKIMKNVCAFIYVSTAYSNTKHQVLEEILYPPPADLEEVKKNAINHYMYGDDDKEITKLIKGYPNTYTFSKALAEQVVAQNHGHLPTIIIRPAIISVSEREPMKGWIGNLASSTGIMLSIAKGWTHVMMSRRDVIIDLIPLDYVANLTIVAASRIPLKSGVTVYHSCTSSLNPITVLDIYKYIKEYNTHHDISDGPFNVSLLITTHKMVLSTVTCMTQTLPALLADAWLGCKGKKPKYYKLQSKVIQGRDAIEFFTSHSWEVRSEGARLLSASLNPQDRERFRFDPVLINWREYFINFQSRIEAYLSSISK